MDMLFYLCYNYIRHINNFMIAPVAQGIERRPPEPGAQVRFLPGAPKKEQCMRKRALF